MTVRLLIDYAPKAKQKLHILFIDFEKAYDKIERAKLIKLLRSAGCFFYIILSLQFTYIEMQNTKSYNNQGKK